MNLERQGGDAQARTIAPPSGRNPSEQRTGVGSAADYPAASKPPESLAVVDALPNKKVKAVVGGFHLIDSNENITTETGCEIAQIASTLDSLAPGAEFYTGHCTGGMAYATLEQLGVLKLDHLFTGKSIVIP